MNQNKKDILTGFAVFALEILLFYYLWGNNIILTFLLLVISGVILVKFSTKEEKVLYLVCFVLGPIFDLTLVPRGVWNYGNPTLFNVPLWLPVAYGLGTVMIVKIGNSISKMASG